MSTTKRDSKAMAASLWKNIFGPRLYRVISHSQTRSHDYQPNALEHYSDNIIKIISFCWSFSYYTSPIIGTYLYRKSYFTIAGLLSASKFASTILIVLCGAYFIRGVGRFGNAEYCAFLSLLDEVKNTDTIAQKRKIQCYDFEFSHWPVDFRWDDVNEDTSKPIITSSKTAPQGILETITALPCQLLTNIVIGTVGRRLVYPGSTGLLGAAVWPALLEGRGKLLEKDNGTRAKLLARDNNEIDTMFLDRRGRPNSYNGHKLVICCEGNAGFYEVGCMVTPNEGGYSVLGWNHPGFAGSTGIPYPENEANAVDVVVQYAIHRLGFHLEDIVLFAWSIGGFSATLAAERYPDIGAVVLDATFDDIVPLAIAKMPESLMGIIVRTLREHMNLNVANNLCRYNGPVRIIRRTKDEVITTSDIPDTASNRGNDLLIKLMKCRYPQLMDEDTVSDVRQFLGAPDQFTMLSMYTTAEVEDSECQRALKKYISEHTATYPLNIGNELIVPTKKQLAYYLVCKYLLDFEATHCSPLPSPMFIMPWDIREEENAADDDDDATTI